MVPTQMAVIPDNATPEACVEVADAYAKYLHEQATLTFGEDPERTKKVRTSLTWCETTLAYWLGFLVGPDGSAMGPTASVLEQIAELRIVYPEVPDIEGRARGFAKSLSKRTKASARASVARQQAKHGPATPSGATAPLPPPPDAADALEAALARACGLTIDQYRDMQDSLLSDEE